MTLPDDTKPSPPSSDSEPAVDGLLEVIREREFNIFHASTGVGSSLTMDTMRYALEQMSKPRPDPPFIMGPAMYRETLRRVRAGEDVRLPLSGRQFYEHEGRLALRWPENPPDGG